MLTKLLDRLIRKSGLAKPDPWLRETLGLDDSWAGPEITAENALQSSAVAACVRLLSESVASLPLHVYRREGDDKARAAEHPLYAILHDQPNDYQTSFVWRAQAMAHVLLHGNSYSIIDRDDSNRVRGLWPVMPSLVSIRSVDGRLEYTVFQGGERKIYDPSDVLHFKGPSLDGIRGMSVISMARQGISLDRALTQHGAACFKNGGRPGIVIKSQQILNAQSKEMFLSTWRDQFSGALAAGKAALVDGGMEIQELKTSNDDSQFLQSRQFSVQEIARWFRVSPHLIGDPSRLAYASAEVEMLSYLQHSLRPWLINLEAEINMKLLPWRTQFFAEFSIDALQRADTKSRYESYAIGIDKGFLTVEDIRRWENLPPITAPSQPEVTNDL